MFEYKIDNEKTSKTINNILDIACHRTLVLKIKCQNCPINKTCEFLLEFQKSIDK